MWGNNPIIKKWIRKIQAVTLRAITNNNKDDINLLYREADILKFNDILEFQIQKEQWKRKGIIVHWFKKNVTDFLRHKFKEYYDYKKK